LVWVYIWVARGAKLKGLTDLDTYEKRDKQIAILQKIKTSVLKDAIKDSLRTAIIDSEKKLYVQECLSKIDLAIESLDEKGYINDISIVFEAGLELGKSKSRYLTKADEYERVIEKQKRMIRELPFKKKAINQRAAKGWVQEIAKGLWTQDKYKNYRIGEMADLAWAISIDLLEEMISGKPSSEYKEEAINIKNYLPNSSSGLKPYLREIAPPEASRRGRPANK